MTSCVPAWQCDGHGFASSEPLTHSTPPQPAGGQSLVIGAQRAYFKIGNDTNGARQLTAFNLGFGEGTQNGICHTEIAEITEMAGAWYSLDGRRLSCKLVKSGVYVNSGRKVVIK